MYFPLQVGDVVIRKCAGGIACDNPPLGWTHLNKEKNDDAIFRMVSEAQPSTNRKQRRAAAKHRHKFTLTKGANKVCECGAVHPEDRTDLATSS